ncbi:hypothetical protein [Actinomyces vulturis]|uniref:hypothetical protein n=1 Tax=Actinomyces vulturis TaxID=1857645 RepID=UPI00082BEDC9|nr:hypothetical protein [Actinomyces vulturis]
MKTFNPHYAWRLSRTTAMKEYGTYSAACEQFATYLRHANAALLVRKVGGEIENYLLSDKNDEAMAISLAEALGARAKPCDIPGKIAGVTSLLSVDGDGIVGRSTLAGVDPAMASEMLSRTLNEGEEIIVFLTPMKRSNIRIWRKYADNMPGSTEHHSLKAATPLMLSAMACAKNPSRSRELISKVFTPLPGFDTAIRATTAKVGLQKIITLFGSLFILAGLTTAFFAYRSPDFTYLSKQFIGGIVCAVAALALLALFDHRSHRIVDTYVAGKMVVPSNHARFNFSKNSDRLVWPFTKTSVPMSAPVICGMFAPQSGATSGLTTTKERRVPPTLYEVSGPPVFTNDEGKIVRLDSSHLWGGVAAVGAAGTGKSVLIKSIFAWLVSQEQRRTIIGVETKPDGLIQYRNIVNAVNEKRSEPIPLGVIEIANPSGQWLDIFYRQGDNPIQRGEYITDILASTFGDGAIMGRSREVLSSVIGAALCFTDEDYAEYNTMRLDTGAVVLPAWTWFWRALALVGRFGDETGSTLYALLAKRAQEDPNENSLAAQGYNLLSIIWGPATTTSSRRSLVEAGRNKLDQLKDMAHFIAPENATYTWGDVINSHHKLIIGTGPTIDGRFQPYGKMTEWITAMIGLTLQSNIERNCFGWQQQNRRVTVMCDEFKYFAGYAPAAAKWWKDDGRSYGVEPIFATQYPDQLSQIGADVLTSFMSYQTFVSFRQDEESTANEVARKMARDGSQWSGADIATLEQFTCAVSTMSHGSVLPAFTAKTIDSCTNPSEFVEMVQ